MFAQRAKGSKRTTTIPRIFFELHEVLSIPSNFRKSITVFQYQITGHAQQTICIYFFYSLGLCIHKFYCMFCVNYCILHLDIGLKLHDRTTIENALPLLLRKTSDLEMIFKKQIPAHSSDDADLSELFYMLLIKKYNKQTLPFFAAHLLFKK